MRNLLNQKWDLTVVDALFTSHGFALASYLKEKHGTPYIEFATTFIFSFQTWSLNSGFTFNIFKTKFYKLIVFFVF